ncbi:type IV secretory system conjugative DNA transfer family protein, partial [Vibrio parahaemolyticus]|nr:type IV secretory system conjugative DNA transfer family protein [Vibrio parahaemolyticus]
MIGRILWDIIKFCIKFGWPVIAWFTFLLTYAGTVEPYIPAAYQPVVMVALPLGYLAVAFLTGLNAMLFVAGALCLWYGLDAAFLIVSAGANQVASGDYTFWQIATSHFYVLTGLLALLTTAGGVFGVVYAIPRLRKVATAVTSLGTEKLAIRRTNSTAFGNSDWVPRKKVEEMSAKPGLVLAQLDDKPNSKLMRVDLESHVITIAPTRTGKGLLVNANLLMPKEAGWQGPILSVDPKGQTFHIVAQHRASLGRRPILVDPYGLVEAKAKDTLARYGVTVHSAVSDRFNFLDFIPRVEGNPCKIRDDADLYAEAILNGCFIPDKNGKYFQSIARGLLEALIFWVIETETDTSLHHLGRVYDILTLPWEQLEAVLKEMLAAGDSVAYGICAKGAAPLLNAADKERGSHLNTAADALKWVKYPRMRAHIETSTFDIEDLCDDKIDIFVVIPPSGLDSESPLRLWVRLWATLPLLLVQQKLPKKRVLLVLD